MKFTFEEFDGHILANIDDNVCLIDTGSPVTFGAGSLPSMGNPTIMEGLRGKGVTELGTLLGKPFDILIGTDILGKHSFLVDSNARTITFDVTDRIEGVEVRLESIGVPILSGRVDGQDVRLALDTGAKVTFLMPSLVAGGEVVGHYDDFYITCGAFTCGNYRKAVGLADVTLDLIVGELPPDLENGLGSIGIDGILGNDIFNHYPKVLYDLPNGILTLGR
ncbi:MAG TPA: hypothetical protein PLD38_15700 [Pyrinomonadaceae bacterium]|nr:hypothetical protein [Chloracidobacterium sp.]MBP9109313.1 hypothetical protein [Pyrinomonadaceae bacterium]HQY68720.1 hypothetical protein [Pyrinomonadaceae bacterium]HRA40727.1 hypothetical protein [Pyrinomonadaceae bacterium]